MLLNKPRVSPTHSSWRLMTLPKHIVPGTNSSKTEPSPLMDADLGLFLSAESEAFSRPSEYLTLFFHLVLTFYWDSEELRASVSGFPNNIYCCCESVEEGQRALDKYVLQPETPPLAPDLGGRSQASVKPKTPSPIEHPVPDAPKDESWWCCFAGADPGVYMGLYVVTLSTITASKF